MTVTRERPPARPRGRPPRTGHPGVHHDERRGIFRAFLYWRGELLYLGRHATAHEARAMIDLCRKGLDYAEGDEEEGAPLPGPWQ